MKYITVEAYNGSTGKIVESLYSFDGKSLAHHSGGSIFASGSVGDIDDAGDAAWELTKKHGLAPIAVAVR